MRRTNASPYSIPRKTGRRSTFPKVRRTRMMVSNAERYARTHASHS